MKTFLSCLKFESIDKVLLEGLFFIFKKNFKEKMTSSSGRNSR